MVDWIRFVPGQTQNSAGGQIFRPFGSPTYAADWDVDPMFISTDKDEYDIAAIFIAEPFDSPQYSIDTYMPLSFDTIVGPVNVVGYPGLFSE